MSALLYAGLAASLALVAGVAALLGIGGGVMYTPLQILFGVDIHTAASTSLFLIMILSFSATSVYRRAGKVDWKLALVLESFTIAGGFSGGYFSDLIPSLPLTVILIIALILSGVFMLHPMMESHELHVERPHWYDAKFLIALLLALLAGAISGLVGIGGGVLKVPLMAILLSIPIDVAIATSAFMIGITAAAGFSGHLIAGHWDWRMSLILAPGVFLGAYLGAHTMLRVNKRILRIMFGILMLLISASVIIKLHHP